MLKKLAAVIGVVFLFGNSLYAKEGEPVKTYIQEDCSDDNSRDFAQRMAQGFYVSAFTGAVAAQAGHCKENWYSKKNCGVVVTFSKREDMDRFVRQSMSFRNQVTFFQEGAYPGEIYLIHVPVCANLVR